MSFVPDLMSGNAARFDVVATFVGVAITTNVALSLRLSYDQAVMMRACVVNPKNDAIKNARYGFIG